VFARINLQDSKNKDNLKTMYKNEIICLLRAVEIRGRTIMNGIVSRRLCGQIKHKLLL
jgi:hypothetical protein